MSDQPYCTHTRADGTPCRGLAMTGTGLCFWHNPATEEERAAGLRRPKGEPGPPLLPESVPLETPEDVQRLLSQVANQLATAEHPDLARAHSLSAVAGVLLRAVRLRDLQRQVAQLTADLEAATQAKTDLERQLTYARQDNDRYRRTLAEMRDQAAGRR